MNKDFWRSQPADAEGMCLNADASKFEKKVQLEIHGYLPELKNKNILELGAGVGRYTGFFAKQAHEVVAVDYIKKFIEKNIKFHQDLTNITFIVQDVMKLDFEEDRFDFIFMNWLLMYLSDAETRILRKRIEKWLKPEGLLFLRESCNCASIPGDPVLNTHYRDPTYYERLFNQFDILNRGNIKVYERLYGNPNQKWWIFKQE